MEGSGYTRVHKLNRAKRWARTCKHPYLTSLCSAPNQPNTAGRSLHRVPAGESTPKTLNREGEQGEHIGSRSRRRSYYFGGRGDPLTPLRAYKHTTVQSHSQAPCLAEYGPYTRTPFPRATVPRHAPTQTEPAGVRPHPPTSKSKNREPLRPPQRFGAQPEPRAAAWGRTHAQEFIAARAGQEAMSRRLSARYPCGVG